MCRDSRRCHGSHAVCGGRPVPGGRFGHGSPASECVRPVAQESVAAPYTCSATRIARARRMRNLSVMNTLHWLAVLSALALFTPSVMAQRGGQRAEGPPQDVPGFDEATGRSTKQYPPD